MNTGWEIRPLGWLLLALFIGAVLYYTVNRMTPPPKNDL